MGAKNCSRICHFRWDAVHFFCYISPLMYSTAYAFSYCFLLWSPPMPRTLFSSQFLPAMEWYAPITLITKTTMPMMTPPGTWVVESHSRTETGVTLQHTVQPLDWLLALRPKSVPRQEKHFVPKGPPGVWPRIYLMRYLKRKPVHPFLEWNSLSQLQSEQQTGSEVPLATRLQNEPNEHAASSVTGS